MAVSKTVGLDIGSQLIKVVELTSSPKDGMSISAMGVAPTPPGVFQNGMLTDPQAMGLAVKHLLKDSHITSRKVVGCITGQSSVVVRIIEVPRMTPAELAETMKWEVERHVPFAPTEVQMDYQPLPLQEGQDENNPNMSVLLAVAQQDMVNYYVEMMTKAGLDPIAIDIEPLSAGRALLDIDSGQPVRRPVGGSMGAGQQEMDGYQPGPKETVAIVNIGATNTDISIFEDGLLIFPRSLALAGESLTKAISEGLGYQVDQAERMKIEHGRVLLDRVNDYNNQDFQPEAVEFPYGQAEEDFGTMRPIGLPDSGPLGRSAFDSGPASQSRGPGDSNRPGTGPVSGRISSGPLGSQSPFGTGPIGGGGFASPGALDLERTQPIQRRALDLARRGASVVGGSDQTVSQAAPSDPAVSELTVQIFDAILPVLSELSTELRRSLDYYRSRAAGKNVDRVILCGGTASLPGLDSYLDQELQVPVQVASPFNGLSVATRSFDPSHVQAIAPLFTVAVGLAARPAVFSANPDLTVKKGRAPKAPRTQKAAPAVRTGGNTSKPAFTMPTLFGKKGGKGDGKGNTTLPPTS